MPESLIASETAALSKAEDLNCPICGRLNPQVPMSAVADELMTFMKANAGVKGELAATCLRCVELFSRAKAQVASHNLIFEQNAEVLPTHLRLDADERFTGRGVTIAFLDSGFYAHDDLTNPINRIAAYHSIFDAEDDETATTAMLYLGSLDNVHTATVRAFRAADMDKILAKLPTAKKP